MNYSTALLTTVTLASFAFPSIAAAQSAKDIVGKMRNPGPGMTRFDAKTVSDKDAQEIAAYILQAYK